MRRPQFTLARCFALLALLCGVLAATEWYRDIADVSWAAALLLGGVVAAPLVLTAAFGEWMDILNILAVILPFVVIGLINPFFGMLLALPAGLALLGAYILPRGSFYGTEHGNHRRHSSPMRRK